MGGGGLQNGKITGLKLVVLPSRYGKTYYVLPFKGWKLFSPPFSMKKTSSSRVKTTVKLCVPPPPTQHDSNFFRPPFCRGKRGP